MSASSDIRYGRRGGGWVAPGGLADESLKAVHAERMRALRDMAAGIGEARWPLASLDLWRDLADDARMLPPRERTRAHEMALEVDDLAAKIRRRSTAA